GSPFCGSSIFKTSAPKSASCEDTALPATSRDRSTTRTPSSGQAASGSNDFSGRLIGGAGSVARRGAQLSRRAGQRKPGQLYGRADTQKPRRGGRRGFNG